MPQELDDAIGSAEQRNSAALEAIGYVYGSRQNDHGPVVSCFERCATIMNAIKDKDDTNEYSGKQVALMMIAMKLARRQYKYKRDNIVDLIGYSDLLQVFEEQNEEYRQAAIHMLEIGKTEIARQKAHSAKKK